MLQDIAAKESCVMTGRSGFHVFRDHPNHLSILIQASMPFRVEQCYQQIVFHVSHTVWYYNPAVRQSQTAPKHT